MIKSGLYSDEELHTVYIGYTGNGHYTLSSEHVHNLILNKSNVALFLMSGSYKFIGEV